MKVLGIDLGGTKLSLAVFSQQGELLQKRSILLANKNNKTTGDLITDEALSFITDFDISSLGIAVPGIYHCDTGTVWAPNIPGWEDYPLLQNLQQKIKIPVRIDSDRACYILGEAWKGNAMGCNQAIYLAIGTGISAGILIDGKVLRGADDIAGAAGWLAFRQPFAEKYISCGCFEYYASGEGIARVARECIYNTTGYEGILKNKTTDEVTAYDVFDAYERNDEIAKKVFNSCIECWGMSVANLVSLFNPRKIILGGGVFGPATRFIEEIKTEAEKWAQPVSMKKVVIEASALGSDAGLYGAGYLALHGNEMIV